MEFQNSYNSKVSFCYHNILIFFSVQENATVALHSIIGTEPWKVVTCGEGTSLPGDPLNHISTEFKNFRVFSKYNRLPSSPAWSLRNRKIKITKIQKSFNSFPSCSFVSFPSSLFPLPSFFFLLFYRKEQTFCFFTFLFFKRYAIHKPALLSGGAVGYVSYDCVRYFEPRAVKRTKKIKLKQLEEKKKYKRNRTSQKVRRSEKSVYESYFESILPKFGNFLFSKKIFFFFLPLHLLTYTLILKFSSSSSSTPQLNKYLFLKVLSSSSSLTFFSLEIGSCWCCWCSFDSRSAVYLLWNVFALFAFAENAQSRFAVYPDW